IEVPKIEMPKIEMPKIEIPAVPARGIDVTTPSGALDVPTPRHVDAPTAEIPNGTVREPVLVGGGSRADAGTTVTSGTGGGSGLDVSTGGGSRHSGVDVSTDGGGGTP